MKSARTEAEAGAEEGGQVDVAKGQKRMERIGNVAPGAAAVEGGIVRRRDRREAGASRAAGAGRGGREERRDGDTRWG